MVSFFRQRVFDYRCDIKPMSDWNLERDLSVLFTTPDINYTMFHFYCLTTIKFLRVRDSGKKQIIHSNVFKRRRTYRVIAEEHLFDFHLSLRRNDRECGSFHVFKCNICRTGIRISATRFSLINVGPTSQEEGGYVKIKIYNRKNK